MSETDVYSVIKRMRELSDAGVPFSFSFVTCNLTTGKSKGLKTVNRAVLRRGYTIDKSSKHRSLIAYKDFDNNSYGQFYIPLLMSFNT